MQQIPLQTLPDDVHQSSSSEDFLTDLSEDIFIEILGQWLELSSVLSLRRVCKRLAEVTHMRELWIALARRLVIEEGLPWPQYALPLFDMPSETIEWLTIRSLRMNYLWGSLPLDPSLVGGPSALIRYGQGQITWLYIVRSKWLVVGLKDCLLALWDIESPCGDPVASYKGVEGFIMSGVTQSSSRGLTLTVNTSQDQTYYFDMDLPFLGIPYTKALGKTNFVMRMTVSGYSMILDNYEGLLGFAKTTSENIPVAFDIQQETSIRLLPGDGVTMLQYTVAMQFRCDVAIVAKDWNVELYSIPVIKANLQAPSSDRTGYARPLKSFSHPYDCMMWRLGLQPRSRPMGVSGVSSRGWCRWGIHNEENGDATYHRSISVWHRINFVDAAIVKCCWGESGQRIAYIGESNAPVAFCSFAFPPSDSRHNDFVRWAMPFNLKDFPWFCDIDEAAGVFVMGTACGRIWIFDPSTKIGRASELWEAEAED